MKEFTLNSEFLTDVPDNKIYNHKKSINESVANFYNRLLKNNFKPIMHVGRKEHPKFTKLREYLGRKGYISIERRWYNGDIVLKSFKLNGELFEKGNQFPCAAALKFSTSL